MAVDPWTGRPALTNVTGGLSGPAIKPVALYMVRRAYEQVAGPAGVPIMGLGGIQFPEDVIEFIRAGATAVSVGTANFVDPETGPRLVAGLRDGLARLGCGRVSELVGRIEK